MWHTPAELISSVIISLGEEVADNPQLGWTRGNVEDNVELLSQINALRIEKDNVEKEYIRIKTKYDELTKQREDIACGDEKYTIYGTKTQYSTNGYGKRVSQSVDKTKSLTWDEIFSAVGPHLTAPVNLSVFQDNLRNSINSAYDADFSYLNDNCVQTIKIQLSALGLIKYYCSSGGREGIVITEKGSRYLVEIKTIKK